MRYIFRLLIASWFFIFCAVMSLDAQIQIENLSPEKYFDFWIGDWKVKWKESEDQWGRGTNKIEKILDGTVILENFEITEGESKGFKGKSMSVYRSNKKLWKQAWVDNKGGYFDFTGTFEGQKRIFQTRPSSKGQDSIIQRMVFYNISEDSFTWDWESSKDNGDNWTLNWRIFYEKIK